MKTFEMEVQGVGETQWSSNSCVYSTEKEAEAAGRELLSRWFGAQASRAVESDKPVNYKFNFETGKPESLKQ